jgi:glycosyltransferase involved in cell wall biosynthesis
MDSGPIALLYAVDAYVETSRRPSALGRAGPLGLMGRQVAGREFLDAYFRVGRWSEVVGLVRGRDSIETLVQFFRAHPAGSARGRRLRVIEDQHFHADFLASPPATILHLPCPIDPRYAWARQGASGPPAFALSGVTHTLCSSETIGTLNALVTAPLEPFDTLICTSKAVLATVRAVTGAYADYLKERHGGSPTLRARLETIPLGVDVDRFRPAPAEVRAERRKMLGIEPSEVAVLFVGRLSHHAKAHPFPIFRGVAEAARRTGRAVHLILAGWASVPAVGDAYVDGARVFAPGVRVSIVDGTHPPTRAAVWEAADLFISPSDNLQETFGLVIIEALASGLPVVASDWDGYRDLVRDGATGFLVPSLMVENATRELTARLLTGAVDYDHFLAESSQAVTIDINATAAALARLISDDDLRHSMGAAARQDAVERFAWPRIIQAYEDLWHEQDAERRAFASRLPPHPSNGPACYPDIEQTFAAYPTRWLDSGDRLTATAGAPSMLDVLLAMPLTHHVPGRRSSDPALLRKLLDAAAVPCPIAGLDAILDRAGVRHRDGRATLAWMLKYDLLRVDPSSCPGVSHAVPPPGTISR